jgi:hypothetical protein
MREREVLTKVPVPYHQSWFGDESWNVNTESIVWFDHGFGGGSGGGCMCVVYEGGSVEVDYYPSPNLDVYPCKRIYLSPS